ncbi:MAG: ABC transporter permease [Spirochaetales bacterium]|nr:ABC transporter permease [Spirochaetales bacterium]
MKGFLIIFTRDSRELWESIAFKSLAVIFAVLTIGIGIGTGFIMNDIVIRTKDIPGEFSILSIMNIVTGNAVYFASFLPLIFFIWIFGINLLTREKANGTLETLLATPLRPAALIAGKAFTVFLPAFIISCLSSLIIFFANMITAGILTQETVTLPFPIWVTCLAVNPLLFLGLTVLIIMLSFLVNPDAGILLSFPVGFGLMIGVPILQGTGITELSSPLFLLMHLALAILLWIIVLILFPFTVKEKIVLSGKTD